MPDILGKHEKIDVAIIGGGPAGLSAATELKRRAVPRVVVLERESSAGGIPRHCGHPPFGMREFKRILTGPGYAQKLVEKAQRAGVEIHTDTSVIEARPNGKLLIATSQGTAEINANRVIYATGVREMPRSARLISGERPVGVINTGALQSMIYLHKQKPFLRPLIVGTELVSFSSIMTCRHANIKPVMMIDENQQAVANWAISLFPRLVGIPLRLGTQLITIEGDKRVSNVVVEDSDGNRSSVSCDGVILTGKFTPEASLAQCGHLLVDPATRGPIVDQYGRCSDRVYFAAGNLLRPVETAGWSWNEGKQVAGWVADDLAGKLPGGENVIHIYAKGPLIKYCMPQKHSLQTGNGGMRNLQLRFTQSSNGTLTVSRNNSIVYRKTMRVKPERRILVPLNEFTGEMDDGDIELAFETL